MRTLPFWSMLVLNSSGHTNTTSNSGGQLLPEKCLSRKECMGIGGGEMCHFRFELLTKQSCLK